MLASIPLFQCYSVLCMNYSVLKCINYNTYCAVQKSAASGKRNVVTLEVKPYDLLTNTFVTSYVFVTGMITLLKKPKNGSVNDTLVILRKVV